MSPLLLGLVLVAAALAAGALCGRAFARAKIADPARQAGSDGDRLRREAEEEAARQRRKAEIEAREVALAAQREVEAELESTKDAVRQTEERLETVAGALAEHERALEQRTDAVSAKTGAAADAERAAQRLRGDRRGAQDALRRRLEEIAGESADHVRAQLAEGWIEETRSACAARLRALDQESQDPEHARQAKRIMGISTQRYEGHYLTERPHSVLPIAPGTSERVLGKDGRNLQAIEAVAGIKLTVSEAGDSIRIEGLDGVGREVARRALTRIGKGMLPPDKDPAELVETVKQNLNREIQDLGRRAFHELDIPRSHPEIVQLVGRLNYRTSYTQNQWKHAVEAAFLCGMMAEELGLDVKLARRAALMHDIGKALTHEIDGSHAVIGADYARRLGEPEIVANAIGAHHADEPPNSIYAYLVAAGDAMSGARPGARREQTESYVTRLVDLQRIAAAFPGVEQAHPVQAGREVRVYVRENEVSDEATVALSGEIAKKISAELTFPGQIKITVVREFRAVEVAS